MNICYIETTVVSLLVANPSRDLATAGQEQRDARLASGLEITPDQATVPA
jgi:hypothetical protein